MPSRIEPINDFEMQLLSELSSRLPSCEVSLIENKKNNNVVLRGITILEAGKNIAPTIYTSKFEALYSEGKSIASICDEILKINKDTQPTNNFDVNTFSDYNSIKKHICYKLVNTAKNKQLLDEVPHRAFHDLSILYYVLLENGKNGTATITIKNNMLQRWNISEEMLFDDASQNMSALLKAEVKPMEQALYSDLSDFSANEVIESNNCIYTISNNCMGMYVASNSTKLNGASVLLYDGLVKESSHLIDDNLYILPSSTHELLFLPQSSAPDPSQLLEMVKEVNSTELSPDDFLSDNVYFYDMEEDTFSAIF